MYEEQKVAIEQRYRHLLEDSIQDAIFLSARNNELVQENEELGQSMSISYIKTINSQINLSKYMWRRRDRVFTVVDFKSLAPHHSFM